MILKHEPSQRPEHSVSFIDETQRDRKRDKQQHVHAKKSKPLPEKPRGEMSMAFKNTELSEAMLTKFLTPDDDSWYISVDDTGKETLVEGYFYAERIDEPWQANVSLLLKDNPLPEGRYFSQRAPEFFHQLLYEEDGSQTKEAYDSHFLGQFATEMWLCAWLEEHIFASEDQNDDRVTTASSMIQRYESLPYNQSEHSQYAEQKSKLMKRAGPDQGTIYRYAFGENCGLYKAEIIDGVAEQAG